MTPPKTKAEQLAEFEKVLEVPNGFFINKRFTAGYVTAKNDARDWLSKALTQAEKRGKEEATKNMKGKIGLLRQWLNERHRDRLVTNEDLETWLLDTPKDA